MKITQVDVNKLKPAEYNPRKWDKKIIADIKASIERFGIVDPIIANSAKGRENIVIGGHLRLHACKELGYKEVPVFYVNIADLGKEKELNLRLNKNVGEWDFDLLANFDEEMLFDVGFKSEDIDKIFGLETGEDDFDAESENKKIVEPTTKLGDLYQLGRHRLLCGDATIEKDVRKLMGEEKADLVFCDPPYNVGYDYDWRDPFNKEGKVAHRFFNDRKKPEEYQKFIKDSFQNAFNVSQDYSSVYCWYAMKYYEVVKQGLQEAGWYISQTLIWLKNSITLSIGQDYHRIYEPCFYGWKDKKKHFIQKKTGNKYSNVVMLDREDFENYFDVLYEQRDKIIDYRHPTQKPVRLAERALKRHSERGHIILDLFGGSGSTLIACEQMQRRCFTMEIDPIYCDVIINRWEKLTGKKAEKITE